jgi:hypothetical protein
VYADCVGNAHPFNAQAFHPLLASNINSPFNVADLYFLLMCKQLTRYLQATSTFVQLR